MLFVNDTPFSIEIFEWAASGRSLATTPIEDDKVVVFKKVLKEVLAGDDNNGSNDDDDDDDENDNKEDEDDEDDGMYLDFGTEEVVYKLSDLSLLDFFNFYKKVMELAMGIHKTQKIRMDVNVSDIKRELDNMFHMLMIWIHHENHENMGSMEPQFIHEKNKAPSQRFVFTMYYIVKEIEDNFKILQDSMQDQMNVENIKEMDYMIPEVQSREATLHDNIIISFDLNDFVMETCDYIKDTVVTDNHTILAIDSFDQNFAKPVSKSEVWRRLYPSYFDKAEKTFKAFWKAHKNESIIYFLIDYLRWDITKGLTKLPFYKIYVKDNQRLDNLAIIVDMREFKRREKEFYKEEDEENA